MMARALLPQQSRFNLKSLVKFFKIPYDEQRAHRATYDAFLTYQLFLQLIKIAQKEHQITKIKQLSQIKRSNQIIHKNIPF